MSQSEPLGYEGMSLQKFLHVIEVTGLDSYQSRQELDGAKWHRRVEEEYSRTTSITGTGSTVNEALEWILTTRLDPVSVAAGLEATEAKALAELSLVARIRAVMSVADSIERNSIDSELASALKNGNA